MHRDSYDPDEIDVETHNGAFGQYVTVKGPGLKHSLAIIGDIVHGADHLDEGIQDALQDHGFVVG